MNDMQKLAEGLNILLSYEVEQGNVSAAHEVLYVRGPPPDKLSEEHREQLKEVGWNWHDIYDSWEFKT